MNKCWELLPAPVLLASVLKWENRKLFSDLTTDIALWCILNDMFLHFNLQIKLLPLKILIYNVFPYVRRGLNYHWTHKYNISIKNIAAQNGTGVGSIVYRCPLNDNILWIIFQTCSFKTESGKRTYMKWMHEVCGHSEAYLRECATLWSSRNWYPYSYLHSWSSLPY